MAVLRLVDGITKDGGYFLQAYNEIESGCLDDYQDVRMFRTERHFDKLATGPISFLTSPLFKLPKMDQYGDFIKFFLNKKRARAVTRELEQVIWRLQEKDQFIDVWAHSLGTIILLCSRVKVRSVKLFASPLGLDWRIPRKWVQEYVRDNKALYPGSIEYYWSKNDFVSCEMDQDVKNIMSSFMCPVAYYEYETSHSILEYLQEMLYHNSSGSIKNKCIEYGDNSLR